ncbi:MAG: hypothetical protein AB8B59_19030 [Maribacter sp.]
MKSSTKKIAGFLLMTFVLMYAPQEILANSEDNNTEIIVKDDLIGGWEYTVAGAPEGYNKGLMMIVNQGGVYKVQVQINGGAVNGENVLVKGNKVTFTLNVEGETVSVALEAKGSKLSGTSMSPSNGTMNITGVKSISPQ